jgi:nitrosocyanin
MGEDGSGQSMCWRWKVQRERLDDHGRDTAERRRGLMRKRLVTCLVGVLMLAMATGLIIGLQAFAQAQSGKEVTLVNLEFEGTKMWIPGAVVVKKGDTVQLKAINNVKSEPPVHGLAIDAYGIKKEVNVGKPESLEFKADKAGIFPIYCHLHPAHISTQLVVLE